VFQFVRITPCPFAGYHWKESDTIIFIHSHQLFVYTDKIAPELSLLKGKLPWFSQPRLSPYFTSLTSYFLFASLRFSKPLSFVRSSVTCAQNFLSVHCLKPPGLLVSSCVVPPEGIRVVKAPHVDQSLWMRGFFPSSEHDHPLILTSKLSAGSLSILESQMQSFHSFHLVFRIKENFAACPS